MSKNISLKSLNTIVPSTKRFLSKYGRHAAFIAVMFVLIVYVFVVFKINSLANAEPTPEQENVVTTSIPKIDGKAINQIQSLENNNAQVHSLFESARNNPFQE